MLYKWGESREPHSQQPNWFGSAMAGYCIVLVGERVCQDLKRFHSARANFISFRAWNFTLVRCSFHRLLYIRAQLVYNQLIFDFCATIFSRLAVCFVCLSLRHTIIHIVSLTNAIFACKNRVIFGDVNSTKTQCYVLAHSTRKTPTRQARDCW